MRTLRRRYVTNETNAYHTFDYVWQHQADGFLNNRPKGISRQACSLAFVTHSARLTAVFSDLLARVQY